MINKNNFTQQKFEWQDEYYAASVSESVLDTVRDYIKNQEEHHGKQTFQQEFEGFLKIYGFENFKDWIWLSSC